MKHTTFRHTGIALSLLVGLVTLSPSAEACGDMPFVGEVCVFAFNFCPSPYFLPADGRTLPINAYQALYALLSTTYGGDGMTNFKLPDLRGRVVAGAGAGPGLSNVALGQMDGKESMLLTSAPAAPHTHPVSITQGSASGTVNINLSGGTVSGQTIDGSVTVNALNGSNPPGQGVMYPDSSHNTIGKTGTTNNFFAPSAGSSVAVPTTHNLTIKGGSLSGTVPGTFSSAPVSGTAAVVGVNTPSTAVTIPTVPPRLALTVCIAAQGIFPTRP